ncbi:NADP-dependent oxidoreductase [Cellulomonas fengjieae]|uniref:NADP-dependent oxidoreductase n=1 Tax=Cellulomonas fengjieae TaxID=2819978 RepID=UPI001AAE1DC5|nr:NADP-dependent oxidoreductase [Cellulomonas fengjieae]MBO3102013.1 NADP-dependent oxidoreductase [Cellulomonas fengjieae]
MPTSTQVQLVRRPQGWPVPEDFRTVTVDLPDLGPDQVRVANAFLSVDPYMRGRMNDAESYVAPFALDATMTGGAVGRVVESTSADVPVGAAVTHDLGWRDVAQGDAARFRVVDDDLPLSAYLGVLGMTAFTAHVGLLQIAQMKPGEVVFVSGAAGAVGSMAGQIARLKGASRVIGSAGSPAKVARVRERYGFDAAFDYKDGHVYRQLRAAAPDGIDVYFDNVGGVHLEAAIGTLNRDGRVALCGAISGYNDEQAQPGPRNMARIIQQGLTLRGFTVGFHPQHYPAFVADMREWVSTGQIAYDETVIDGLDHAVDAFLAMMRGETTGKTLVRL